MGNCNCHCEDLGPTLEGLGHFALYTKDIEKTVDFYTGTLGFQKIEDFEIEKPEGIMKIVFLMCVDIIMEVIQEPAGTTDGVFQHLAIQVTGLEELIPLLKEEGQSHDRCLRHFGLPHVQPCGGQNGPGRG